MSTSFTYSNTQTFTLTHAKYLASKVATDLKRMQRLYGSPSDFLIDFFEKELTALLKGGYLDNVIYGFKKDDKWIEPTLRYTSQELSSSTGTDDDPGKIRAGANITNADFYSYLIYNQKWNSLSQSEKESIQSDLPFTRGNADAPRVSGYFSSDKSYSSGGRSLERTSLKSF